MTSTYGIVSCARELFCMNKSSAKDDAEFVRHIVEAINLIEQYVKGVDEEAFIKNNEKHDAAIRELIVIGEAAKGISDNFKAKNSSVEWRKLAGVRDIMVHQYFKLNLDAVWSIIDKDLPGLKNKLTRLAAH